MNHPVLVLRRRSDRADLLSPRAAHLCDLANLGNLPACTRSLVPQTAKIIPHIFRIMAVREPPGQWPGPPTAYQCPRGRYRCSAGQLGNAGRGQRIGAASAACPGSRLTGGSRPGESAGTRRQGVKPSAPGGSPREEGLPARLSSHAWYSKNPASDTGTTEMSTTTRTKIAREGIPSTITSGTHMPVHAALTQATTVTACLLAGSPAGSGGWAPVSSAGMSALRAARSAEVCEASDCA